MKLRLLGSTRTDGQGKGAFAENSSDDFSQLIWSAIDIETTGINPRFHRIVEIAVVQFDLQRGVLKEFASTVNPGRDVSAEVSAIHGLSATALMASPSFADIAGHVLDAMRGSVLVAHNMRFDWGFLESEFHRTGYPLEPVPMLCTLALSDTWNPSTARSLKAAAESLAIPMGHSHEALPDAHICRQLFQHLAAQRIPTSHQRLRSLGCDVDLDAWHRIAILTGSATPIPRDAAQAAVAQHHAYLSTLVDRLPNAHAITTVSSEAATEYLNVLGRALEDSFISAAEAEGLADLARDWMLTREQVVSLHKDYFGALVSVAWADGRITEAERKEIQTVGTFLGISPDDQGVALAERPTARGARPVEIPPEDLRGKSVCFTGELTCSIRGEPITRSMAHSLAAARGLDVRDSITKSLELLVVADPNTQSGKARKARQYGIRIISEAALWRALDIAVD